MMLQNLLIVTDTLLYDSVNQMYMEELIQICIYF